MNQHLNTRPLKRLTSLLLTLALALSLLPAAYAAESAPLGVAEGDWFYDAAVFATRQGLLSARSDGGFDPAAPLSRGEAAYSLWVLSGKPASDKGSFSDVAAEAWNYDAVRWADAQGILPAAAQDAYGAADAVTREAFVTALYALANRQETKLDATRDVTLTSYADASGISGYAVEAMRWACNAGIVRGTSSATLSPAETANRAQAAVMLLRYNDALKAARAAAQSIGLTGVGNARELGGYAAADGRTVKQGVFLRTAKLSDATEEDIARLRDVYHLAVIADFRSSTEVEALPDPEIPGAKYLNLSIMDEAELQKRMAELDPEVLAGLDMTNSMDRLKIAMLLGVIGEQMYITFLSGQAGKDGYRQMFEELLAMPEGSSLLFHCTQGKDRTGLGAMLILTALGVDEETILEDFAMTNIYNARLIEGERQALIAQGLSGEALETAILAMDQVEPQYMVNALDWMKETYGSVMGYIHQELGITDEQIETLRNMYLA